MGKIHPKGLVVIPIQVQRETGLLPGKDVTVRAEGRRAIIELEDEVRQRWLEDFRRMRAGLTASGRETENSLRKIEKARKKHLMHVP